MFTSNDQKVLEKVSQRIAPVWPLKNFVAVNPYAGFADTDYSETSELLASRGGIRMMMPLSFYLDQYNNGKITRKAIKMALKKHAQQNLSVESLLKKTSDLIKKDGPFEGSEYNLIDIAVKIEGKNWKDLMVDRVSSWAAAHFDGHVGTWKRPAKTGNLYGSWKLEAQVDRTAEIMGLNKFRSSIKTLPDQHFEFISSHLSALKLDQTDAEAYLHALMLKVVGWSSYVSGLDFHNKLYSGPNSNLIEFIAILLTWENYFLHHSDYKEEIKAGWYQRWHKGEPINTEKNEHFRIALILQEALDLSGQFQLKKLFAEHKSNKTDNQKIKAQITFCIDVRSEVYRRNLEMVDPEIETVGFAGFFGFPVKYVPLGHKTAKNQCPVLIPSSALVKETCEQEEQARKIRVSNHQISKTWKKFKSGAITSFGFVSPLGLSFLPKILLDSFHITRPVEDPNKDGIDKYLRGVKTLDLSGISLNDKASMAANTLTGMGLKDRLAPLVLIVGHGSTSINNPHASGLDCGACGGHSGEVNALTAQYIFNDPEVREKLKEQGVIIPTDTLFVACLHDTTTDEVHIINDTLIPEKYRNQVEEIKSSLGAASKNTRLERSLRLNIQSGSDKEKEAQIKSRAQDWSQIRPEWGLAGCHSFVVAPRERSRGLKLDGKSFLHNYDWHSDPGFKVLEGIMTAPMVVTSWINLQYFASTTDNNRLGAGNKTLHNITSGIGVVEGSGGDLRIGLPLQSVHNGEKYEHTPLRLNVIIEAPIDAIEFVLKKHDQIRQLFDNEWIFLHRMNERGVISQTYIGNMQWEAEATEPVEIQKSILQTL